jgi:hypothetical protein
MRAGSRRVGWDFVAAKTTPVVRSAPFHELTPHVRRTNELLANTVKRCCELLR